MKTLLLALLLQGAGVEAELERLTLAFNEAYAKNDLDTYFAYYAEDVTFWYDTGRSTLTEYRDDWYELVRGGGGVESNDISDVRVQVGPSGDSAVVTYVVDVVTRYPDGSRTREQAYETDVWFKRGASWKLVHLHYNAREVDE